MTSLEGIEHEIGNILAVTEELDEENWPTALEYLQELSIQEEEKVDGIVYVVRKRQADIEFIQEEERRLKERRQSMEKRLAEFKEYLSGVMQDSGLQRLRGRKGTIFLRASSSVEIKSINELPSDYVETRVDYKPLKNEISQALKDGYAIPGAEMKTKQSLVIR